MKKILLSIITSSLFTLSHAANSSAPVAAKSNASAPSDAATTSSGVTVSVACSDGSACDLINDTSTKVLSAVNKGVPQSQTMGLIQTVIIPQFDFALMTKYALGNNWKLATKAQQDQLVDLFKQLLIYTYSSALSKFKNASININKASEDEKKASVITEVKLANNDKNSNQPILVEYDLAKTSGAWKVYDVKLENVSLVTTYRNQFTEVVQNSKIDGLIKQLQTKVDSLKANKGQ